MKFMTGRGRHSNAAINVSSDLLTQCSARQFPRVPLNDDLSESQDCSDVETACRAALPGALDVDVPHCHICPRAGTCQTPAGDRSLGRVNDDERGAGEGLREKQMISA